MASGDLRVVFDIKGMTNYQPISASICVYNLAPNTAKSILAAFGKTASFSAGYPGNVSKIFSGDIKWVNLGKDNATDTTTTVFAAAKLGTRRITQQLQIRRFPGRHHWARSL